jgi:hypothetical protein
MEKRKELETQVNSWAKLLKDKQASLALGTAELLDFNSHLVEAAADKERRQKLGNERQLMTDEMDFQQAELAAIIEKLRASRLELAEYDVKLAGEKRDKAWQEAQAAKTIFMAAMTARRVYNNNGNGRRKFDDEAAEKIKSLEIDIATGKAAVEIAAGRSRIAGNEYQAAIEALEAVKVEEPAISVR